jgi:hypothetical protein
VIERAKQIGRFISNLTSSFALIAQGKLEPAVQKVEDVLKNGLSLAVGFLASAAGLTKIAGAIKNALSKIQKPVQKVLDKIAGWFNGQFSRSMAKVRPSGKPLQNKESKSHLLLLSENYPLSRGNNADVVHQIRQQSWHHAQHHDTNGAHQHDHPRAVG